jgi:hypothetical protein
MEDECVICSHWPAWLRPTMRTAIDRVPVRKRVCDECLKAFYHHLRLCATVRGQDTIKPWQLYRTNVDGKLQEKLAEAVSREELWKIHKRRPDYNYGIATVDVELAKEALPALSR